MEVKDKITLLFLNHQQIQENIKFADQKAGAVIAANGALLALSYSLIHPAHIPHSLFAGLLVCFVLLIGIGSAFWVVRPRGEQNRKRGYGIIDAIRINLSSHEQFQHSVSEVSDEQLLEELVSFIYDRAHIDQKKYFYLKISMVASLIGWISALLFAVWIKMSPFQSAPCI